MREIDVDQNWEGPATVFRNLSDTDPISGKNRNLGLASTAAAAAVHAALAVFGYVLFTEELAFLMFVF